MYRFWTGQSSMLFLFIYVFIFFTFIFIFLIIFCFVKVLRNYTLTKLLEFDLPVTSEYLQGLFFP